MCGAVTVGFKVGWEGRAYKLNLVVVCVLQQVTPDVIGGGCAKVRVTGIQVHHQEHWSAFVEGEKVIGVGERMWTTRGLSEVSITTARVLDRKSYSTLQHRWHLTVMATPSEGSELVFL